MNHWPFIVAAYAVTVLGTLGTTGWAYLAMRRAEMRASALKAKR